MQTKTLWLSNSGRMSCESHLGYEATSELSANPKTVCIDTSFDTWRRMNKRAVNELSHVLAELGTTELCEGCRK